MTTTDDKYAEELEKLNKLFANRYTDKDEEYVRMTTHSNSPPIMPDWDQDRNVHRQGRFDHRRDDYNGRRGYRDDSRGRRGYRDDPNDRRDYRDDRGHYRNYSHNRQHYSNDNHRYRNRSNSPRSRDQRR